MKSSVLSFGPVILDKESAFPLGDLKGLPVGHGGG